MHFANSPIFLSCAIRIDPFWILLLKLWGSDYKWYSEIGWKFEFFFSNKPWLHSISPVPFFYQFSLSLWIDASQSGLMPFNHSPHYSNAWPENHHHDLSRNPVTNAAISSCSVTINWQTRKRIVVRRKHWKWKMSKAYFTFSLVDGYLQ